MDNSDKGSMKSEAVKPLIFIAEVVVILGIISIVFSHFFAVGCIEGDSMQPTFFDGECLLRLRTKTDNIYQRGDIINFTTNKVIFVSDKTGLLKRIIGLPGEVVEISDRKVFVDGKLLDEPYAKWDYSPIVYGLPNASIISVNAEVIDLAKENCVSTGDFDAGAVRTWRVPEGSVFVLGDNCDGCLDSRSLGIQTIRIEQE